MRRAWWIARMVWKWRRLIVGELHLAAVKVWLQVVRNELAEIRRDQLLRKVMHP